MKTFILILIGFVKADFISDWAEFSNKNYLIFHENDSEKVVEKCQFYFCQLYKSAGMARPEDLHVFSVENFEKSHILEKIFESRTYSNVDSWLINITLLNEIPESFLEDLNLDLDDEVTLFKNIDENEIEFWEIYKISREKELIK